MKHLTKIISLIFILSTLFISSISAQDLSFNAGADVVSRYIWRGLDFGKSPAIQPSLSASYSGFELGAWGSYTLNETASGADELDLYMSYSFNIKSVSLTAMITDYYFPNNGIRMGNYNNHDDDAGPGAHTFEAGVSIGSEKFPLAFSAYYNFYNDAGNNVYLQLDCPFKVKEYDLNLFLGATPGSEDNPAYYGAKEFSVINIGIQASKSVKITNDFSLPVFVTYCLNPQMELSHLVFGVSF